MYSANNLKQENWLYQFSRPVETLQNYVEY